MFILAALCPCWEMIYYNNSLCYYRCASSQKIKEPGIGSKLIKQRLRSLVLVNKYFISLQISKFFQQCFIELVPVWYFLPNVARIEGCRSPAFQSPMKRISSKFGDVIKKRHLLNFSRFSLRNRIRAFSSRNELLLLIESSKK